MSNGSAEQLAAFITNHRRLLVLTGAGCSIQAGIPAYRDQNGAWQRSDPIQHSEFVRHPSKRQRYWARSYLGYPVIRDAVPTAVHRALAAMENQGFASATVTQNVDNLHQKAGQVKVIDLHGNLNTVSCLQCQAKLSRDLFQANLAAHNESWQPPAATPAMPDGDSDLSDELIAAFNVPACHACGGAMKPDVVFFGGSIPSPINAAVAEAIAGADGVLAIGSSLKVFSGYRICRQAKRENKSLAVINPGPTRADELVDLKLVADSQLVVPAALQLLQSI